MIKKYIKRQIQDNFIAVLGQQTGPPRPIHSLIQNLFTHSLQCAGQLKREIGRDQNFSFISDKKLPGKCDFRSRPGWIANISPPELADKSQAK